MIADEVKITLKISISYSPTHYFLILALGLHEVKTYSYITLILTF
jgi:hypothetical protein